MVFISDFVASKDKELTDVWFAAFKNKTDLIKSRKLRKISVQHATDALNNPVKEIPLRFMGQLMVGLTRVHECQVDSLYTEAQDAHQQLRLRFRRNKVDLSPNRQTGRNITLDEHKNAGVHDIDDTDLLISLDDMDFDNIPDPMLGLDNTSMPDGSISNAHQANDADITMDESHALSSMVTGRHARLTDPSLRLDLTSQADDLDIEIDWGGDGMLLEEGLSQQEHHDDLESVEAGRAASSVAGNDMHSDLLGMPPDTDPLASAKHKPVPLTGSPVALLPDDDNVSHADSLLSLNPHNLAPALDGADLESVGLGSIGVASIDMPSVAGSIATDVLIQQRVDEEKGESENEEATPEPPSKRQKIAHNSAACAGTNLNQALSQVVSKPKRTKRKFALDKHISLDELKEEEKQVSMTVDERNEENLRITTDPLSFLRERVALRDPNDIWNAPISQTYSTYCCRLRSTMSDLLRDVMVGGAVQHNRDHMNDALSYDNPVSQEQPFPHDNFSDDEHEIGLGGDVAQLGMDIDDMGIDLNPDIPVMDHEPLSEHDPEAMEIPLAEEHDDNASVHSINSLDDVMNDSIPPDTEPMIPQLSLSDVQPPVSDVELANVGGDDDTNDNESETGDNDGSGDAALPMGIAIPHPREWSRRTKKTFNYIYDKSENTLSFENLVSESATRKNTANLFYELLVLKNNDLVDLQQSQPFGDITISKTERCKRLKDRSQRMSQGSALDDFNGSDADEMAE